MANATSRYLGNNNTGPDLRDWQHAARMFTDSNQVYGPKQNFLFHVAISINPNALRTPVLANAYKNVLGMLVKNVTLPKFTIAVDKVNQYNRKKNIQRQVTYEDATIKFHDDNMGLINLMWQNYFTYYYSDSSSAGIPGAYNKTATRNFSFTRSAYGLDSGATDPFFNYITLYQMAQGEYVSYKLINPIITSWSHETVDYSQSSQPHENLMTLAFEAVDYGSGIVKAGDPEGFGQENYDQTPSPLLRVNSASSVNDVTVKPSLVNSNLTDNNKSDFLNNAIQTVNNYQNINGAVPATATSGTNLTTPATVPVSGGNASNIQIPTQSSTTQTVASPRTL
jgi:hypothetical protein